MHVLLVNQFYPPDVAPTGQHLHEVARCLVQRGHAVTVLCSRRSYDGGHSYPAEELRDGVAVRRLFALGFGRSGSGRSLDYLSFHAAALTRLCLSRGRFDLAVCLTTPPYVGWTVGRALGRRAGRSAHWVMDLYPDVLAAHGSLRPGTRRYRALAALTRREMAGSRLVLALGERTARRVAAYAPPGVRVEPVPLWGTAEGMPASGESVRAWRESRGWSGDECVLLYSGNMGLGHRFDEFLAAASRLGPEGPVWAFAGGGTRRAEIERFVARNPHARVQLLPYLAQEQLGLSLCSADVHLVSLRGEWQGLIVPSKLQAAFAVGRPVIFVGGRENEVADWIAASSGGWIVGEGDVHGLLHAVEQARDPTERERRGRAALAFAREHFDRGRNTARIAELLEGCVRG